MSRIVSFVETEHAALPSSSVGNISYMLQVKIIFTLNLFNVGWIPISFVS